MRVMRGFKELNCVASATSEALSFSSQEFRVIRFFLRLMSLWRPISAGFFERYVYPIFVNLLLLTMGVVRNSIQATEKTTWLSIQVLYIVHEVAVWLGHLLGNRYFASRDLETNVLNPVTPLNGVRKPLFRKLKFVNAAVIISMTFFSIMLCVLFVMTEYKWNHGAQRFSATLPNVHGPLDHILYGVVILIIVYDLGIGLALFWTLAFLYGCYAARLKILENIFLKWKHSSVDAVSYFIRLYAQPVKRSWKRISWWFLAHNIVALAIPLYGYELAQAVSGRAYHSKHLPQFICYLLFILTLWLAPIVMSEQVKRRERKFLERINDISPWLLDAVKENRPLSECGVRAFGDSGMHSLPSANDLLENPRQAASLDSIGSSSTEVFDSEPKYAEYTFVCRGKQLRDFLRYLKGRTLGLVSRGYSLQLNLSLVSLIGGAISFISELNTSSEATMYADRCNCTIS